MFGIYPIGMMTGMYSPYGMYGYGVNRHQMLYQQFGPGYSLNSKPYPQGYPMPYLERRNSELEQDGTIRKFIKKHFS